ncbi:MAG: cell division protein FtsL [Candidatus Berkiellales bacterium]
MLLKKILFNRKSEAQMRRENNASAPTLLQQWATTMGVGLLSSFVFFSAMSVIYHKHASRQLFMRLQQLQQEVESLQVEWSQLLLEQGTWGTGARVERIARERLQMTLPEPNEVVVITK